MAKTRYLVVDASVAASAGKSEHPESRFCRDFLVLMTEVDNHVVMTPAISAEWNIHMGHFAREWLAIMFRQGRVRWLRAPADKSLRRQISLSTQSSPTKLVMLEDTHLIEAALAAHSLIASKDDEARTAFASASKTIAALRKICWVNPVSEGHDCLQWLREGARQTARRSLEAHSMK